MYVVIFSVSVSLLQKLVQSRKTAAYCAHSLFPFSHIPSRYVSLIACGDSQLEVREEGLNGLCPRLYESNPQFPPFADVIQYISSRVMMQCFCVLNAYCTVLLVSIKVCLI